MKKNILTIVAIVFAWVGAYPQHTELELVRSAFKLDKKAKVASFMQLPDSSAKKFWPIYNEYERERSALGDRKVKLLEQYSNSYKKINAATAEKLWKESTAIQRSEATLREKYAGLIKKSISGEAALDFYMIEDYIATAVKEELYSSIPVRQ